MNYDAFVKKMTDTAGALGSTVGKAANTAVKKGGALADRTRLSLAKYALLQDRDALLCAVGSIMYAARSGVQADEKLLQAKYAELDRLTQKLARLEDELAELSGCKTCAACGQKAAADFEYCPKCGEKF